MTYAQEVFGMDPNTISLNLVDSVQQAEVFMRWLGESREALAVDTETGGLEWWQKSLRMVQFGDLRSGWAIPWERWGGVVVEAMKRYDDPLVMWNAKFDTHFLEHRSCGDIKIPWSRMNDGAVLAHLLEPTRGRALKTLAGQLVHPMAAQGQGALDAAVQTQGWGWDTIPIDFEPYWQYGALDAVLTAWLFKVLSKQYEEQGRSRDLYLTEIGVLNVLFKMETKGCLVDVDFARTKHAELEEYSIQAQTWCEAAYGVNPGSNQQVAQALLADGVELIALTKGGAWRLDEEVLESIDHPLAAMVLRRRKVKKILGTYLENVIGYADEESRIHCDINSLGARTGRMSISRPALQTLPRNDKDNPLAIMVRDCFVAPEGHKLILADFDQVEMRVMAHFAGDAGLRAACEPGRDIHTETARLVYGDPTITKKEPRRQVAKNAGFAKIYGAGTEKFALTAGITYEAASDFLMNYDRVFPGVRAFQTAVSRAVEERMRSSTGYGWVMSPFGRYHPADPGRPYACVNYLCQGTAADVFKIKLVELDLAGLGDFLVLPVHDEVILEVPDDQLDDVRQTVKEVMGDTKLLSVPLTVDTDVVERWGNHYR
jgi:DNA polymerase-1